MELAASALILLVLLLPGFILQTSYAKGFWYWKSPPITQSITERIPYAVISASLLHLLWSVASALFGYKISVNALLMLLLGNYGRESARFDEAINAVSQHAVEIFSYFLSLYLGAALLGYSSHALIRKFKLDRRFKTFRFSNEWFYLLSGEVTQFYEVEQYRESAEYVVYLTTVVHHSEKDYLYRGIVFDFFFDKSGILDKIVLRLAHRRCLSEDRAGTVASSSLTQTNDDRYYEIIGDYFILKYAEMSTINLDYFAITPIIADAQATVAVAAAETLQK